MPFTHTQSSNAQRSVCVNSASEVDDNLNYFAAAQWQIDSIWAVVVVLDMSVSVSLGLYCNKYACNLAWGGCQPGFSRCRRALQRLSATRSWTAFGEVALTARTELVQLFSLYRFNRAMLCIRGTSHGPVSVCLSVRPSQVGVLLKRLNVGSGKQQHTIVQGL